MRFTGKLAPMVILAMSAAASPLQQHKRQDIDIDDLIDNASPAAMTDIAPMISATVVSVPTAVVVASVSSELAAMATATPVPVQNVAGTTVVGRRSPSSGPDSCTSDPFTTVYTGLTPDPDTPDAFTAFSEFSKQANGAISPNGFTRVYQNENAASASSGWYKVKTLETYNPQACADFCVADVKDGQKRCKGFNIYYERDPQYSTLKPECPVPGSITNVKCVLHSYEVTDELLGNPVQYRNGFKVVHAGSNGYVYSSNDVTPDIEGFQPGHHLGNYMLNVPATSAPGPYVDTYMGVVQLDGTDIGVCGPACLGRTARNKAQANGNKYRSCNYFVAAQLYKGSKPSGVVCALYSYNWQSVEGDASRQNPGRNGNSYKGAATYLIKGYNDSFRTEL